MLSQLLFHALHPFWRLLDRLIPKHPFYWAFSTHHLHTDRFIENQRALFEHLKQDPAIRKFIFYRGPTPDLNIEDARNFEIVRHGSLKGLFFLLRCKVVFLTHSISMDYSFRWENGKFSIFKLNLKARVVVNLWHGIPLKRLLYAANDAAFRHTDRVKYRAQERKDYAGLIASSDIDSYAMAAMFYPLNYRQVWITGLPRNDFLRLEEDRLPNYIRESVRKIRSIRGKKQLIVYAPTYRQTKVSGSASYYQFSKDEIKNLRNLLLRNNAILGYRPHYFKNSNEYFNLDDYIDGEQIIDMSQKEIPEFSAVARELDLLITDYSSVYIEALYLHKPIICFGYDIDHYRSHEDGLLYDMDIAFPGPVTTTFDRLLATIESELSKSTEMIAREQAIARRMFFKYEDTSNSARVTQEILKRL